LRRGLRLKGSGCSKKAAERAGFTNATVPEYRSLW
jgi:hypothetical protein